MLRRHQLLHGTAWLLYAVGAVGATWLVLGGLMGRPRLFAVGVLLVALANLSRLLLSPLSLA